jgi:hypothetical protein
MPSMIRCSPPSIINAVVTLDVALLTLPRLEHGSGLDERACLRTISLSLSEKVACAVPEQPRPIGRHAAVDG